MQVKVFEAKDMTSGLKMVKEELGPDALILSTRTLRGGKLGMLGKPTLEITAAIDSAWPDKGNGPCAEPSMPLRNNPAGYSIQEQNNEPLTYQNLGLDKPLPREKPFPNPLAALKQEDKTDQEPLASEISELRSIINSLSSRLAELDTTPVAHAYVEPEYSARETDAARDPVVRLLLSRGLNHQVAGLVARFTDDVIGPQKDGSQQTLQTNLTRAIGRLFTVAAPLATRPGQQKRMCLIGPTGVGKTTTIAKLAAGYLQRFGGKVALITIDTYRIAAVEQLKVYGEIMNLPVEVVLKPTEMAAALARHNDCDLILIDTAGRSPGNGMEIQDMCAFLRPEYGLENHLMLSATNREVELETIIRQFSCLSISNFIFSKVDECRLLGVILNIHYSNDTPISYLTNGQRVPEDIIAATPEILAELIMNPHGSESNG